MSVSFQDVYNAVQAIVSRPDLVAETKAAIRKATYKLHYAENWALDSAEVSLLSADLTLLRAPSVYGVACDISSTLLPRFRKCEYVRLDGSSQVLGEPRFVPFREDTNIVDGWGVQFPSYWYQQGGTLVIRDIELPRAIAVGYYRIPDITEASYSSWIADEYIDAISEEAAAAIYRATGNDSAAQKHESLAAENLQLIKIGHIT